MRAFQRPLTSMDLVKGAWCRGSEHDLLKTSDHVGLWEKMKRKDPALSAYERQFLGEVCCGARASHLSWGSPSWPEAKRASGRAQASIVWTEAQRADAYLLCSSGLRPSRWARHSLLLGLGRGYPGGDGT